jgi:hypothetical protein
MNYYDSYAQLNPGGTLETRMEIADLMGKVYATLDGDFDGKFLRHSTMSDKDRQKLVDDHFLFRGKDKMQAASGYHEHWPQGRGVYLNKDKTFVNWVNEGDHVRIISMEQVRLSWVLLCHCPSFRSSHIDCRVVGCTTQQHNENVIARLLVHRSRLLCDA